MKLNYFSAIGFLKKYISRHKKNFIMFYFGWFFDMILSFSMPVLFGIMIDEIIYFQNITTFLRVSLVFVIMSLFSCVLYFLIYAQHHYLMNMYTLDIKKDIFDHLLKCDAQYMSDANSGDIISTLQHYSVECMHFVIRNIIHFINEIINAVIVTAYIYIISWPIGIFVTAAVPVSLYLNTKFSNKIRKYADQQREIYGKYIGRVFEVFSGIRDIRMLGGQQKASRNFVNDQKYLFKINVKTGILSLLSKNVIGLASLLIRLSIFVLAGYWTLNGNMTIGVLTIVIAFYSLLNSNVEWIAGSYLDAQNRISYIQRIHDFLNSPAEDRWKGENDLVITRGKIEIMDLCFSYNKGSYILNNLSLEIEPGERLAIAGHSGCGKSTLAYMMIGFYSPQQGSIKIDGQNLSDCSLKTIRDSIGLIQQDVLIFDGTIKENLLLGNRRASIQDMTAACQKAGIWDFIEELPDKLNTVIGTKGAGLSGGQKQRIAIARIYLKNPKVIIFDEATSSVDNETEEAIHEAWRSVLQERTSIVIAHRQSAVMLCDRVALLEEGKIIETDTPSGMIKRSVRFNNLFAIKQGEKGV
ncbi:MAG: ABC transporter ATP-binding protein/permease [Treponema sp.]|jgi:ABC-type bacteriocin/lantibiotic exporter with double-glycine peptidase domain|nr:ABC transporter ATP-binding protein/permease [Treponema sp.]